MQESAVRNLRNTLSSTSCQLLGLAPDDLQELVTSLQASQAPLLWLGNGLRRLGSEDLRSTVKALGIPYLTTWTSTDLFSPIHELYAGHAGTYGGRAGLLCCNLVTY